MPKGSLFLRAVNRIRPWTQGEPFSGISIIDTVGGIRERSKGIKRPLQADNPDPGSTSWPVAKAVSNVPPRYPSGILGRASPLTGELGRYDPDDAEILYRLFGITGPERQITQKDLMDAQKQLRDGL